MFFFIAGIQPRTLETDDQPHMCASCGLFQARMKRMDHYLSIFFFPLVRIKKGIPFMECLRCGHRAHGSGEPWSQAPGIPERLCPTCGGPLDSAFRFCPTCGKRLG